MSQRISLREFQRALSQRIQDSATQTSSQNRLAIQVGGQNWLVDMTDISEVATTQPWIAVPMTKTWFLGVTNIRGRLYTVVDLAAYAGLNATTHHHHNRLLLSHPRFTTQTALLVDRALGLRNIDVMRVEQTPSQTEWLTDMRHDEQGQIWHNINLGTLLTQTEFLSVGVHS